MIELKIKTYDDNYSEKWDDFVMNHSVNGTFLQTKNFLDYHGDRFDDASIIIYKGNDTTVAVISACTIYEDGKKIFSAHQGSTFGGIVIADNFYNIEHVEAIVTVLEEYLIENEYNEVCLKCTSDIFARQNGNLLYYFLFQRGYISYDEISFYVDFGQYNADIASNFNAGRRRDYKYSLKNGLAFRRIETADEIRTFYDILCGNLLKFDAKPVHSFEEITDFKESRLRDIVEFYGVFYGEHMIASSMIFVFDNVGGNAVFHTQYLAADQSSLKMYPMNFMDYNLIQTARDRGFRYFSFGTSTHEHGKVLNKPLAEFKEGFGTQYGVNKTYVKRL